MTKFSGKNRQCLKHEKNPKKTRIAKKQKKKEQELRYTVRTEIRKTIRKHERTQ